MTSDPIAAITDSIPPASDYLTYLTILESHLSPEILPTLSNILQDAELTQNIGWDLVHLLLPMPGAEQCLDIIARLGNPREVVLKATETLQNLDLDHTDEAAEDAIITSTPTIVDQFCTLVELLSIVHPRIKTKYPSRFLSTSLISILSAYRPSNQTTQAVISFVHTISDTKRPPLPGRKSSASTSTLLSNKQSQSAPDPEAQDEDPQEAAIQRRLLQSFVTHILEEYVKKFSLQWATRLLESHEPRRIVAGRKSVGQEFRDDEELQALDTVAGQLVALARDLGLSDYNSLYEAIYQTETDSSEDDEASSYPTKPSDIPLSRSGSLFLVASYIFSSAFFQSKVQPATLTIFPDHAKLLNNFIGIGSPETIGMEEPSVIDAILVIGVYLEHENRFVSGPLDDEVFLQHLQSLSLLSAKSPSPTLRYTAHVLTSAILYAHPVDRLRLTFISDTLEHCPFDALRESAVSWLKDEIIRANQRQQDNIFSSTVALSAVQPYLVSDLREFASASSEDIIQQLTQSFPFHMAVVNFLYFISAKQYSHLIPPGMMAVVEEMYLGPLRTAQERATKAPESGSDLSKEALESFQEDMELLGERMSFCTSHIAEE